MKWINSSAAAVAEGEDPGGTTNIHLTDEAGNIIGSIGIPSEGRIIWGVGSKHMGTADSYGQAKSAVEKLSGKD